MVPKEDLKMLSSLLSVMSSSLPGPDLRALALHKIIMIFQVLFAFSGSHLFIMYMDGILWLKTTEAPITLL